MRRKPESLSQSIDERHNKRMLTAFLRCLGLTSLRNQAFLLALAFSAVPAFAIDQQQQPLPSPSAPLSQTPKDQPAAARGDQAQTSPSPAPEEKAKDDRMFYVMPNYLTVEDKSHVKPISWKEKFSITAKEASIPTSSPSSVSSPASARRKTRIPLSGRALPVTASDTAQPSPTKSMETSWSAPFFRRS